MAVSRIAGDHRFVLLLILITAIFFRSIPVITNTAWGFDLGIYYGIALRMISEEELFIDYDGWGSSYQYFPVLYILSLGISKLTGLDLLKVMVALAPVIGGLTVLLFYMIVMELTRNRRLSLMSSALLAVAPFHVYQTSHAAPMTVGHLFMLSSLFLFLKFKKDKRFLPFLLLSTILLILSHHLTTYFYLITIAGMIIWRSFKYGIGFGESSKELGYLILSSIMAFSYWRFVAKPVYYAFMRGGTGLEPHIVIIFYFLLILVSIPITFSLRRHRIHLILSGLSERFARSCKKIFLISFFSLLAMEIYSMFFNIPATNIRMNPTAILLSIPLLLFASLSVSGLPFLSIGKGKSYIQGWLIAIGASLLYSLLTGNTTLYPERHIEYLMVPMCLPASLSIIEICKELNLYRFVSVRKKVSTEVLVSIVLLILVVSNGVTVYPSRYSLRFQDEEISDSCISATLWLRNHTHENDTIATDLRLSHLIWAYGMNATFDETERLWTCKDWRGCIDELEGKNRNYSRVTYILIDDVMRDFVVCLDVRKSVYMNETGYEKFLREPFELVYRNVTLDSSGNIVHWAEVYKVNWSYIATEI
ncbi:MAG TPA: hypothetical protein ENG60_01755 [Thermoplasmatales archaeon]|nr:hypothetical protein [Thermoplasmatales archaeon]HEX17128.1 hypothetical protein [Thermoplasmatales archaeon]